MLKTISKNKWLVALVVLVFGVSLFGVDNYGAVNDVVTDTDKTTKATLKVGVQYLIGFLPLGAFLVLGAIGYKNAKQKSEQDKDNKVGTAFVIWGTAGAIIAIFLIALLGGALTGNSENGLTVLYKFWKEIFGVASGS